MPHSIDIFSDVFGRYSHSLFSVSNAEGVLDVVSYDISRLEALLVESLDLRSFIQNPIFSMEERRLVVDDLINKANFCVIMGNFLQLLVTNKRLSILPTIIKSFRMVCLFYRNEVIAHVRTFSNLSLNQQNQLKDCLEKMVCKRVILDIVEDSALIGGFVVEINSHQIDASLRTKLFKLGFLLKEVD